MGHIETDGERQRFFMDAYVYFLCETRKKNETKKNETRMRMFWLIFLNEGNEFEAPTVGGN